MSLIHEAECHGSQQEEAVTIIDRSVARGDRYAELHPNKVEFYCSPRPSGTTYLYTEVDLLTEVGRARAISHLLDIWESMDA